MLLLALAPALLVAWLMARGSLHAAQELAGNILFNVAGRVQLGTEAHLGQAHNALNGLLPEQMNPEQKQRARRWLDNPARFEAMAFALTRQSPDVPHLYLGNKRGEYLGVQSISQGAQVSIRGQDGVGRNVFVAGEPGDRSLVLPAETVNFEPRTRAWYQARVR
ncbi:MAG: histidine kinase, partial [Haliea sp.]